MRIKEGQICKEISWGFSHYRLFDLNGAVCLDKVSDASLSLPPVRFLMTLWQMLQTCGVHL